MTPGVLKQFLTHTDETGRFIVSSGRTGKVYFIEPIDNGNVRTEWGSIDPATKQLTNKKGHDKYKGAVTEAESLITPENGFVNIALLEPGTSPFAEIERRDAQYPDKAAA
jgi:hypothetical protein